MNNLGHIRKIYKKKLDDAGIIDSYQESIALLSFSLGISDLKIISENNLSISDNQLKRIDLIFSKRLSKIPLAYITNEKNFNRYKFYVNENVLIPRFETEELVDNFLKFYRNSKTKGKRLIDIGTGSGIIPIILQKELPTLEYFGIEISLSAIKVAKRNIYLHKSKINLLNESIKESKIASIDFVLSNPPYIKSNILKNLSHEVKNEPKIALDGGKNGARVIKEIFEWEQNINKNNAVYLLLEIDEEIYKITKKLAEKFYPNNKIEFIEDMNKNLRFISISEN